jgi:hypothetical protein
MNGKPSSPVLRGLGASNGARLLDPNRVTSELPVTRPEPGYSLLRELGRTQVPLRQLITAAKMGRQLR